jgi:ketosteroid isomerase-like protein
MKRIILLIGLLGLLIHFASAQIFIEDTSAAYVSTLNKFIDHSVVKKDKSALDTLYAEDFVFTHGTGHVDNKASWLKAVMDPQGFSISREHDSIVVERHDNVAMVYGKLTIIRQNGDKKSKYAITYVRVFRYQHNRWQMISHHTFQQWNDLPIT